MKIRIWILGVLLLVLLVLLCGCALLPPIQGVKH